MPPQRWPGSSRLAPDTSKIGEMLVDRRLLVLAIGMFALGTDSYVVAGVLPEISRAFDVSIGAAGQMTTVYSVTFALQGD